MQEVSICYRLNIGKSEENCQKFSFSRQRAAVSTVSAILNDTRKIHQYLWARQTGRRMVAQTIPYVVRRRYLLSPFPVY